MGPTKKKNSFYERRRSERKRDQTKKAKSDSQLRTMDDYPAADTIPDPVGAESFDERYTTLMDFLSTSKEMRHTATSSFKQSLWAGSGAMAGGMLMGPVGGLVGGIAGSLIGFVKSSDYDGALLHLRRLDHSSKRKLLKRVGELLIAAGAASRGVNTNEEFEHLLRSYASKSNVRDDLWNACLESLQT